MYHTITVFGLAVCLLLPLDIVLSFAVVNIGFTADDIYCVTVTPHRTAKHFFENVESGIVDVARVLHDDLYWEWYRNRLQ